MQIYQKEGAPRRAQNPTQTFQGLLRHHTKLLKAVDAFATQT
ncbi:hypothetical protein D915_002332 [Fasciola hepatica]|uniref:Uncharacterized protein n=1 Tax=Fasciola hepatica TaxID=6192 RepID=A0A4E0RGP1_FASHE|nr:hypothetical protein D915_002332 [Fasciola hepatica]